MCINFKNTFKQVQSTITKWRKAFKFTHFIKHQITFETSERERVIILFGSLEMAYKDWKKITIQEYTLPNSRKYLSYLLLVIRDFN